MRLRIFLFAVDRAEYHGQWMDSGWGTTTPAPARYDLVVDSVIVPLSGDTDKALCNRVWSFSQNDAHTNGWVASHSNRLVERARSMSMGDIIELEGVKYRAVAVGFQRLDPDENAAFNAHFGGTD